MIHAKERLCKRLSAYNVCLERGGDVIEKVGASARIELPMNASDQAIESAIQDAAGMCLTSIAGKIELWLEPDVGQAIYLWLPEHWKWCHIPQFVEGPVRMTIESSMYDRLLIMEVMAGV